MGIFSAVGFACPALLYPLVLSHKVVALSVRMALFTMVSIAHVHSRSLIVLAWGQFVGIERSRRIKTVTMEMLSMEMVAHLPAWSSRTTPVVILMG